MVGELINRLGNYLFGRDNHTNTTVNNNELRRSKTKNIKYILLYFII